ncbi:MAG: hypothetical protein EBU75_07580 [Betaproteobacteria bacterium]|nr:hypothetical protein [Betaproteobacteria bacterium]
MAAIRKRGARWQARVKRNGLMLEKSFLTKGDALRWARTAEIDIERGVFSPPTDDGRLTLAAALEKYGREVTPQKRGAHIEQCRIRVLVKKPIAQKALAALRPIDVAAYRDERKKSGKAGG